MPSGRASSVPGPSLHTSFFGPPTQPLSGQHLRAKASFTLTLSPHPTLTQPTMSDIDQTQLDQKLEAVLASVQTQEFSDPELAEFIVKAAPELFGETQTQGLLDVSAVGINKLEVGLEFFGDEGNVRISSPEALQPVFNGKSERMYCSYFCSG